MSHRKRKIRYYNFLLIPDNEQKTRSLKIRASILRVTVGIAAVLFIMVVIALASYSKVASLAIAYADLEEENTKLKAGLAKLEELQLEIDKLKKIDQKYGIPFRGMS